MSSEESNKTSRRTRSQGSNSRGRWDPPLNRDGSPCLKGRIINLIQVVVVTQLLIVAATIHGCLMPGRECNSETKQHIANMMTVITTSTFALYAPEK